MSPPAKTRPDSSAAAAGASGWLEKSTNATREFSDTVDAAGPSCAIVPKAYPANAVTTTRSGVECAASAPAKLVTDMPAAAAIMATRRVRYTPCRDVKPVMNAPIAVGTPSTACPLAEATISGIATPAVHRSAYPGSKAERSKEKTVDARSLSQVCSGDACAPPLSELFVRCVGVREAVCFVAAARAVISGLQIDLRDARSVCLVDGIDKCVSDKRVAAI